MAPVKHQWEAPMAGGGMGEGGDGDEAVAIYATFPDMASAEAASGAAVEEGLAACANLIPGMRAIYRWQGKIERGDEVVAILKTRRGREAALIEALKARHPYENPAIVTLPLIGGSADYLDWVVAESGGN